MNQQEEIDIKAVGNIWQKLKVPFLKNTRNWGHKDNFDIPEDLLEGITEIWTKPTKIQGVTIPLIVNPSEGIIYDNLIVQSRNDSSNTGTYVIGSLLRVDRTVKFP
jgi:superfamily II DNA/RNA helicase